MRWPLLIWCAFGVAVMGLKLHLDRTALKYPDVAVRAGEETYSRMIAIHFGKHFAPFDAVNKTVSAD